MPADKDIIICYLEYGRLQDLPGGGGGQLLGELHAVKCLVACGVATRLLGGFGCMLPRYFFEMVQFGAFWSTFL